MKLKLPKTPQRIISIIEIHNERSIMTNEQNTLHQRRNCTLTTSKEYNGKSINTNQEKDQSCIEEILTPINAHLGDMLKKHSQVLTVRFDLRTPNGAEELNNKRVGRIFENMERAIERKEYAGGHNPDTRLIGVQENHGSGSHYHCAAMVNGNAIQNPYTIYKTAERYLAKALGIPQEKTQGLVDYCDSQGENGIIIKRGSPNEKKQVNAVMHQLSYLAKERGKENTSQGQHLYIGTRISKKN